MLSECYYPNDKLIKRENIASNSQNIILFVNCFPNMIKEISPTKLNQLIIDINERRKVQHLQTNHLSKILSARFLLRMYVPVQHSHIHIYRHDMIFLSSERRKYILITWPLN